MGLKGNTVRCRGSPRYCITDEILHSCHWVSGKAEESRLMLSQETCRKRLLINSFGGKAFEALVYLFKMCLMTLLKCGSKDPRFFIY